MNALRNKVQLIGHLGIDPEVKEFKSGKKVAKLSMATSDIYRDREGKKVSQTQWHNLVIWGKLADIAEQYLHKGSEVAVEGRLSYRSYDDSEGNKRYYTEVVVNDLVMLGKKK
jgi:single-strand DNA-binding protein